MEIAIVTGASSGMGREFALQIDRQQKIDEIWAIARRRERLEELQNNTRLPMRIFAYDLTDSSHIEDLKSVLNTEKPQIRLLANCAGLAKFGDFESVRESDALRMIDLNIRAFFSVTSACIPYMLSGGHIIEIASTAAFQPLPDMNVYAATKAFILSYSRALNRELGRKGVSVTAVCPGWTKTEFFSVARENADSGAVKNFLFPSSPGKVVAHALKDAQKGKDISIYGITNILHLFFSKILPANSIMTFWDAMK